MGVWYLDGHYGWSVPIFPVITLLGALGISLIELKSIYERADQKIRSYYEELTVFVSEVAKHKTDPTEIVQTVVDYMNKGIIKKEEIK